MADCDEDRSNDEGYGQRSQKAAAEPEEPIDVGLRQTENGGAAGIDHGGAGDHVKHAERDNERLDLEAPDQNSVGQSDEHARSNSSDRRKPQAVIEHDAGRDHAHKAHDRALREVEAAHQNWKRLSCGEDQKRRALNEHVCEVLKRSENAGSGPSRRRTSPPERDWGL